ncbi:BamA/TamA family outer membrane protein [Flavobacterium sp. GA093]|uniref:BamA/TamA family outer membrane protein n=1 Tax=Flavobacterium hydrocarbonoxydans TaxID=2683249 RepID=A0A6I4NF11_9FLAO|nr:BamA/TamA family outer membrane protein [Flavobacterium hydrocarbonoxydans]MWB92788.1 BamA/TamA family outer membrane protein [Flavobacterium hydrocarbonoxydans]
MKVLFFKIKKIQKDSACFWLMVLLSNTFYAQEITDPATSCPPKALFEIFKKKDSVLVLKPVKNDFFLVIPVIGSQPATGFVYGAVAQYTFKGKKATDKYSIVNLGITYTTKDQLLINMKNSVLLKNNKIFLNGDYRLYLFSQPNYGLSTNIIPSHNNDSDFDISDIKQPMDYNYFKFHQTMSWEVKKDYYIGAGINLDWYSNISDKDLDVENGKFTYHYTYSQKYGFSDTEYFLNGFSFNLVHDSRDNQVNASRGWFANINYRFNPVMINKQRFSNVLYGEYRHFVPLSKKNNNYVLAFWTYGQFVTRGKVPYLNLPAIGWDQRSRSGEGYTQGLFRGSNLIYLSAEFRFPITCNQMISGTVFTNFITASDTSASVHLFDYIQPSAGVGLRILIDKATKTNLIVDYAWGRKSKGFYLNAGETF